MICWCIFWWISVHLIYVPYLDLHRPGRSTVYRTDDPECGRAVSLCWLHYGGATQDDAFPHPWDRHRRHACRHPGISPYSPWVCGSRVSWGFRSLALFEV